MKRKTAILVAIILVVAFSTSSVFAASYYGTWKSTGAIKGVTYKYRSEMDFLNTWNPQQICARGTTLSSKNVGAGWMQVKPLLYKSSGALVKSAAWDGNDSKCVGIGIPGGYVKTKGTYYAQCKFKYWKGTKYSGVYTAYKSPQATIKASSANSDVLADEDITIKDTAILAVTNTEDGQTYGSGLSELETGEIPDLIFAEGVDGTEGYVKADELYEDFDTISEVLENSVEEGDVRYKTIPLYDLDGNVIGEFELETHGSEEYTAE